MPTKFKPSITEYNRATGQKTQKHYYMSSITTKELVETMEQQNTKPKIKAKIANELRKREKAFAKSNSKKQ